MKRRVFLKKSIATGIALKAATLPAIFINAEAKTPKLLNFKAIKASTSDKVIVPDGYSAKPLISLGDRLFSRAKDFDEKKIIDENAIANAALTFGDNTDGMSFFPLGENNGILCVNNEYINPELLFNHKGQNISKNDVLYMQNLLGVSVFEIAKNKNGDFGVVLDSKYNRRITANTLMQFSGQAKDSNYLKSNFAKAGYSLGTINNCANGQTPWGTYLSAEENFDDFFGGESNLNKAQLAYGAMKDSLYGFEKHDLRFNLAKNPNELNTFGFIVEIDPKNPDSTPIKRTSLGRFKHENAEVVINKDNRIVVYMGDDEVNEHIYKFVSNKKYDPKNPDSSLLDDGILFVAKFSDDFSLTWIPLIYGQNGLDSSNGFNSQADICIFTRMAAKIVGATDMDRPEWISADNEGKNIYCTLTNNKTRTTINAANPRKNNIYGHIISFSPKNGDHASDDFSFNIFALAGNPLVYGNRLNDIKRQANPKAGSKNINANNMFNSPDGLKFDKFGRLWIQSDGNYSNKDDFKGMGNNQMLCANPQTGEIKRFLSGPVGAEITGIAFSNDYKTMFVGIQHPGEKNTISHYPNGGNSTPRSTIVQITKNDGGIIGS